MNVSRDSFQHFAIVNNDIINIRVSFHRCENISLGFIPRIRVAESKSICILIVFSFAELLSIKAVVIFTSTKSV